MNAAITKRIKHQKKQLRAIRSALYPIYSAIKDNFPSHAAEISEAQALIHDAQVCLVWAMSTLRPARKNGSSHR